ncbi:hypothetical protein [Methanobacterium sp. MBAC-LM]|uniref:hypothetical protein n=1 Tax=Methanobacterium sp. MBAC-LM TaxID=3412034 RepID=UPI003C725100
MIKISDVSIHLRASFADDLSPDINSEIHFKLKNSLDKIKIESNGSDPIHKITVKDLNEPNLLKRQEELSRIFAISCSLACENVVFSIRDKPDSLIATIEESKCKNEENENHEPEFIEEEDEEGNTSITINCPALVATFGISKVEITAIADIDFDGSKFFNSFRKLLKVKIFEPKNMPREQNFVESLREYELAINSENRYECFKHLFCSLEKMVNIKKEYTGDKFIEEISNLTGTNESDLRNFRRCYNRMKHCSRNNAHTTELTDCLEKIPSMMRNLKKTVDKVILLRIRLLQLYL